MSFAENEEKTSNLKYKFNSLSFEEVKNNLIKN